MRSSEYVRCGRHSKHRFLICWAVASIHLQWLYIIESHLLQLQSVVTEFHKHLQFFLMRGEVFCCPPTRDFSLLCEWCGALSHNCFQFSSHLIYFYPLVFLYHLFQISTSMRPFPVWGYLEHIRQLWHPTFKLHVPFALAEVTHTCPFTVYSFWNEYLLVSHLRYPRNE